MTADQVSIASGINEENIFKLKMKFIEENLNKHPYIKSSIVKRQVPNRILIKIVERSEVLEIIDSGTYVYVDEDGKVLKILSKPLDKILPVLEGPKVKSYQIGKNIVFENEFQIDIALKILGASKSLGYLNDISRILMEDGKDIFIDTKNGIKVAFGTENKIKYKISFMHEILTSLETQNMTKGTLYLDKGEDPVFVPQE